MGHVAMNPDAKATRPGKSGEGVHRCTNEGEGLTDVNTRENDQVLRRINEGERSHEPNPPQAISPVSVSVRRCMADDQTKQKGYRICGPTTVTASPPAAPSSSSHSPRLYN